MGITATSGIGEHWYRRGLSHPSRHRVTGRGSMGKNFYARAVGRFWEAWGLKGKLSKSAGPRVIPYFRFPHRGIHSTFLIEQERWYLLTVSLDRSVLH